MNCITPMIRFYQDKNLLPESERQKVINKEIKLAQKILPRDVVMKKMLKDENLITHLERRNQELEKHNSIWRYQAIPCGHCVACRLKYRIIPFFRLVSHFIVVPYPVFLSLLGFYLKL